MTITKTKKEWEAPIKEIIAAIAHYHNPPVGLTFTQNSSRFVKRIDEILTTQHQKDIDRIMEWAEKKKKFFVRGKWSTDEKRYPIGYNKALDDLLTYLKKEKKE